MHFKIKQKILEKELNKASKFTINGLVGPYLSSILFKINNDSLVILSTNNEVFFKSKIETSHDLQIIKSGEFLVQSKYIYELIKKIDDEFINIIKNEDNVLLIKGSKFKTILNTLNVEEYPKFNFNIEGETFIVKNSDFKEALEKTLFVVNEKERRIVLTGINLNIKNNKLYLNSTDSYCLAKTNIDIESSLEKSIIVPAGFLKEINRLIPINDSKLNINFDNNKILIILKNNIYKSKLIVGDYINTDNLIPKTYKTEVTLEIKDLMKTISLASVISDNIQQTIVNLIINENSFKVQSHVEEIGNHKQNISNFNTKGEPISILFNSKYLENALNSFYNSKKVILKFNGNDKPLIIQSESEQNLTQVILPIRFFNN